MEIKKVHIIGIIAALAVVVVDVLFLRGLDIFYFILGIAFIIGALPFIATLIIENNREKENNEMFLEFARNLVESVKAGTPISRGILILKDKYFGSLTPHVKKLGNQISIGIPVKEALETFSKDVDSSVVKRAVTLISEAEKAGGDIEGILDSVASSVSETENLKKERRSAIYSLVVQGYLIFFIFIVIMLILQFKILPMTAEISGLDGGIEGISGFGGAGNVNIAEVSRPMIYLLLVQGLFTGMIIGKLAEGTFKAGIKHSFIMVALSLLIYTGVNAFF